VTPTTDDAALLSNTEDILTELIAFPTVSSDSNLALIAFAADRLNSLGARISLTHDAENRKANLFATLGPEQDGGIVLSGHTDVVPADASEWTSDPFTLREENDQLFGRGACDMKGFIAAALAVAPSYAALPLRRPVHFAFTYDEETGCLGAQELVKHLQEIERRPSVAIVGEPTEMRVIEGHKGCYEYTTEFTGREGHGSAPTAGVNAVHYAVRYISRLLELGDELRRVPPNGSRFDPPWTTLQVGQIEGGVARNVIAGHCAVGWEMRPVRASDATRVKSELQSFCDDVLLPEMRATAPDASITTHVIGEVQGLEPMEENEARDIVTTLTGSNSCDVVAFGTEAGLFQAMGMSSVVCGPGSIAQAHKPNEFVSPEQLRACLNMLVRLQTQLI